mgnify:CR=1 FL=1
MKPSFAPSLSQDGITLYHRTTAGWMRVGEVDPEAPGLADSMRFLRSTVLGLAPQGFQTKLILPGTQILYLEIEAPGPDRASRRAQIAKALDGRTPYAVSDLAHGSQVYLRELATELKAQGVIDQKSKIDHVNDLLSAVSEASAATGQVFIHPGSAGGVLTLQMRPAPPSRVALFRSGLHRSRTMKSQSIR